MPIKTPKPAQAEPAAQPFPTTGHGPLSSATASDILDEDERVAEQELLAKIWKWATQSMEQTRLFRERHIENLEFASGNQWSEEDLALLQDQKRPAITINRATSILMTVSGLQRRQRTEPLLIPAEPDDAAQAELMQILVKHVRDQNNAKATASKTFLDMAISGLAFRKVAYDFRRRPQGDIKVNFRSLLNVLWDPNYPDVPWDDTEYVIDTEWMSMDDAVERWPDHEEKIRATYGNWTRGLDGDSFRLGDSHAERRDWWDPQTQRIRILQCWYKTLRPTEVAVYADGRIVSDETRLEALREELEDDSVPSYDKPSVVFTTRPMAQVRVAHVLDQILLADTPTPYPFHDRFPVVPSLGYYFWKFPFGLMDLMKDPQREKNKRRTVIAEVAGRTARSGWLNKRGAGADPEDLERWASGAGVNLEYEIEEPTPIKPTPIDQNLVYLEEKADREIFEVVNVNDELLGQSTQRTVSGRAIEARQRGSLITQEPLFDSFNDSETVLTELLVEMIKDRMTAEEAARIIGRQLLQDPNATAQNLDRAGLLGPQAPTNRPSEADIDMTLLAGLLGNAFNIRYDVVISSKPFDPTYRLSVFNTLLELLQSVPIPPDLIIDAAAEAGVVDERNARRIIQALQAAQQPALGGAAGIPDTVLPEEEANRVAQLASQTNALFQNQ